MGIRTNIKFLPGPGPGPTKNFSRDRDRDRDQRKVFTGIGTGPGPGPEKSDFAVPYIKAHQDEDFDPITAMMTHFKKVSVYQESDRLIIARNYKLKALRDV
jgi:hypothetical protein